MGNNNSGIAVVLAVLGLGYLLTRTPKAEASSLNGSMFPWLSQTPSTSTTTREYVYIEREREPAQLPGLPQLPDPKYREASTRFRAISEEHEEAIEESNLSYLDTLEGLEKAKALLKEAQDLQEMVSPTPIKWKIPQFVHPTEPTPLGTRLERAE